MLLQLNTPSDMDIVSDIVRQFSFFFCIQVRDNFSYGYKSSSTRWVFDEDPAYEHIGVTEYVNDH